MEKKELAETAGGGPVDDSRTHLLFVFRLNHLPQVTGIVPMLTPTAALGLAVIMVLATRFHLKRKEPAPMTIGLFVLCTAVVVGRGWT